MKLSVICLVTLLALPGAVRPAPPDVDGLAGRVMKTFEVPGLSVAVVKDGQVVHARGYGVRRLGSDPAVDEHTLFPIASNSKAFTAAALGILADRGRLDWGDAVIDRLPGFRMSDPYVTREMTVRDLLVHRSGLGLGAGDLLFWPPTTLSRKQLVRRLGRVPLKTSFRASYAYDNVLYPVAGQVIEAVSGKSWEDFVSGEILAKVGMKRSTVSNSDLARADNAAAPHADVGGEVRAIEPFFIDNANPAGGINSTAADMAKWQLVLLGGGQLADGSRLFSPKTAKRLWAYVTPMPIGDPDPALRETKPKFLGYALGFAVRDYRGEFMVSHTGGLPGFLSISAMLPEHKLGVVVLTNQESPAAFRALCFSILDHYIDAPKKDWVAAYRKADARRRKRIKEAEAETAAGRAKDSRPSLPLKEYAGTYADRWYGDIVIAEKGGRLSIRFAHTPALRGKLEHWQHDTFVARWKNRELRADAFVTFALTPEGGIDSAKMKAVSPATDFSFDFHDLLLEPKQ